MTRPRNEIPKLRRHTAKNRAFFQFRGKRYYTGRWGSREAEEQYRRLIAEIVLPAQDSDTRTIPDAPTLSGDQILVEDLAAEFLEQVAQRHPPPSREADNIGYAIKELLEIHATTRVVEFTPRALRTFQAHLMRPDRTEGVQGRRVLSRRTLNRRVDSVRKMFRWGVSQELVPLATWQALTTIDGFKHGQFGLKDRPPVKDDLPWQFRTSQIARNARGSPTCHNANAAISLPSRKLTRSRWSARSETCRRLPAIWI
jgi:hypothetical protein